MYGRADTDGGGGGSNVAFPPIIHGRLGSGRSTAHQYAPQSLNLDGSTHLQRPQGPRCSRAVSDIEASASTAAATSAAASAFDAAIASATDP